MWRRRLLLLAVASAAMAFDGESILRRLEDEEPLEPGASLRAKELKLRLTVTTSHIHTHTCLPLCL
jgi:hypothetical protein|tara:strand:+ start:2595 stop:2792 length:198 start_codon:yes stop_codon:yes gene_type:complete